MGGTRNQELIQISKEIWDFLLSRQITSTAEYLPSSLNVIADWESRNHVDPKRLDARSTSVCETSGSEGLPEMDLFASRLNHQLEKYMSWRPDPNSVGTDALQHRWDNLYCYAFPPFCLVAKILKKVAQEGAVLLLVTPTWQTQPWYSTLLSMSIQNPILLPMRFQVLTNPQGQTHPLVKQKQLRASGMDCFRQSLASEGLSEQAADLIANCRRRGSISNYQSAWRKWASWCVQRQIDPIRCDVNLIANFLAVMFHEGYEYSTINCHRSAISAYHAPINSISVGEHPRICSLMTGVFNLRPTKPRFTFIWDVQKVIDHLNDFYQK